MNSFKVYEVGSGKWVVVSDGNITFQSDESLATDFDFVSLASASAFFWEFCVYKDTLFAVPKGTNRYPWDCVRVSFEVKKWREMEDEH